MCLESQVSFTDQNLPEVGKGIYWIRQNMESLTPVRVHSRGLSSAVGLLTLSRRSV